LIAHIHTILQYGPDKEDPMGMLIHITSKAMRLEHGFNDKLLAAPLILAVHVMHSWSKHVWVSTQECGVTLSMDFTDIPLQQHGDIEIMHLFVKTGWKQLALQMLNQCRMHLQVFLLSDIVTGTGESIATQFWDHPHPANSPFEWPLTVSTPQQLWTLWHQALTWH